MPGVDRTLAADLRQAGAALAVVESPGLGPAVERLEADAVLPVDFDTDALAAVLQAHARQRRRAEPASGVGADATSGRLVAVTGTPGAGASTIAQALATHLAGTGPTLLADLALDADQHVRHGVAPGHDGVFELAEALRHAPPGEVVPPIVRPAAYELLCGLRRRQEWVALNDTVVGQVVDVIRRDREQVVADVDPELDGRAETGSVDIEERNGLARSVVGQASVVVVVGRWSTTGLPRLVRLLADLERHGIARGRLRPLLNGAPRGSGRRAGRLLDEPWPDPVTVGHDRRVEGRLREGRPLPDRLVRQASAVLA
jgi:hypothetical protein